MANKSTGIIVGTIALVLVGTAVFFVAKAIKVKPITPPEPTPPTPPQSGDVKNQGTPDVTTPITPQTNPLSNITDLLSGLFTKKASEKGNDKFTDFTFPIYVGQSGSNVKKLQQMIMSANKNLLPKYKDDGSFGSETATALKTLIGKNRIDSQADIDKIKTNAYNSASKFLINQQLGIKIY
jgi:hypothetical protein